PLPDSRRPAVPLDPGLPARRAQPDLGPVVLALERPRLRGESERRPRRRLADPLQRPGSLVRPRRAVRRRERRAAGPRAPARRRVPPALAIDPPPAPPPPPPPAPPPPPPPPPHPPPP